MRGERFGQLGGERGAARETGQHGREVPADGSGDGAFGPDQRQRVGELGGQRLGGVAVRGDGRAAAFGELVEAVGEAGQCLGRRVEQADPVGEREQRDEQRPEGAGGGRGRPLDVELGVVRGGGQGDGEAAGLDDGVREGAAGGGDGDDGAAAAVRLFDELGQARVGGVWPGEQQQVQRAGPAGQGPAQCAGQRGDAGGREEGGRAAAAAECGDEVGDAGGGRAGAGDEDGTRPSVGGQVGDAGLGGAAGGGADPGAGFGDTAQQPEAVGARQRLGGVEE